MTSVTIRQQLSCASKEILEKAGHAEIKRLHQLRIDLLCMRAGPAVLDQVDADIAKTQLAIAQLAWVYVDQFEAGREENDRAGRFGLVNGEVAVNG